MGNILSYFRIHCFAILSETWAFIKENLKKDILFVIFGWVAAYIVVPKQEMSKSTWSAITFFVGLCIFVFIIFVYKLFTVPIKIFARNNQDLDSLRKELISIKTPNIKIEHKENEPDYYNQSRDFDSRSSMEELFDSDTIPDTIPSYWRTCRISVHNLSKTQKIKNVEVKLITIEPAQLKGILPVHLHFTHDNTPPYPHSKDINPDDSVFVDVVGWHWDDSRFMPNYVIRRAEDKINTTFPADDRDYKIKIKATAENTPSVSKTFMFGLRKKNNTIEKIWLWPID